MVDATSKNQDAESHVQVPKPKNRSWTHFFACRKYCRNDNGRNYPILDASRYGNKEMVNYVSILFNRRSSLSKVHIKVILRIRENPVPLLEMPDLVKDEKEAREVSLLLFFMPTAAIRLSVAAGFVLISG